MENYDSKDILRAEMSVDTSTDASERASKSIGTGPGADAGLSRNRTAMTLFFALTILFATAVWGVLFLKNPAGVQRHAFFKDPNDWFMDFYNVVYYGIGRTPYSWGNLAERNYLPLAFLILHPFAFLYPYSVEEIYSPYLSRYSQYPAIAGAVVLMVWCLMLVYALYRLSERPELEKLLMLGAFLCSGVMLFNYDRLNEVILAAALLFFYLKFYDDEKPALRYFAVFCLAFAAALKLTPAVLGVLLLYKKQWKEAVVAVILGIALAVGPFFMLEGSFTENVRLFFVDMVIQAEAYEDGLFGINGHYVIEALRPHLVVLPWLLGILALVTAMYFEERWKQLCLVTLMLLLTTNTQSYYCFLYLFAPIVLFFNLRPGMRRIGWVLVFIALLQPLQYDITAYGLDITNYTVTNTVAVGLYLYLLGDGMVSMIRCIRQKRNNSTVISEPDISI